MTHGGATARWAPDRMLYGGDVNPDQWSAGQLQDDIDLMRRAGVNTATIGVFAWSALEPEPGVYRFDWLDRSLESFDAAGIGVILATPTASPPPWFSRLHPDALPMTADGVRLLHGSRDTYNPAAPAYRAAAVAITRALAEHIAGHPAIRMWHVHNEYGTVSYGPVTDAAFRAWLRARYRDLGDLNAAWHTAFWSQGYAEWEDIHAPQRTQYLPNPAQVLDFKRFSADALLACLRDQLDVVRAVTPGVPVTTNFILPTWNHYDQWAFARELDVVSIDHYPDTTGADAQAQVAFASDLARSFAGGRPWLLMEQAPAATYTSEGRLLAKEPGRMRRHTYQYIARGSQGSLFFQWRAPAVGAEFFLPSMLPHAGADSRIYREVEALGGELAALDALVADPEQLVRPAQVAIVWSADAWWASETPALPMPLDHLGALRRTHDVLWRAGVPVDFVAPDGELDGYRLVLVPSLLCVSDAQRARFAAYVAGGGDLAVWFLAGTADENLHIRPGGYSGAFAELAGVRVEEHLPLDSGAQVRLSDGSTGTAWSEAVRLRGADVIATFEDGRSSVLADGAPAITRRRAGDANVHYIATALDGESLRTHVLRMLDEAGVSPGAPVVDGLEIVRRFAREGEVAFVINHGDRPRATGVAGIDAFTGVDVADTELVRAGDVRVLLLPSSSLKEDATA